MWPSASPKKSSENAQPSVGIEAIRQHFSTLTEEDASRLAEVILARKEKLEEEERYKQESLKRKAKKRAKDKRWRANAKKRLEEIAKQEEAVAFEEMLKELDSSRMLEQRFGNPFGKYCKYRRSDDSTSDQSSSETRGMALPINFGLHFNHGQSSKEAERNKIFEETVTEILAMPNDLAAATNSSFASSHNSSDVPNCNLVKAEDKTTVLHFNQQQSSIESEVRIDVLDADNSRASTVMLDDPSRETRFSHDGTSTLIPNGPQQSRLANDSNGTILGDPIMMPDGPSQEMGELEMTPNGPEERINMLDDNDGLASSSNDEVQPRETRFPNGINNAILGFTGQAMATIVAANSQHSLTIRLFAYATGIGFYGSLFAALFLKRHPNIAKTLFKIGVSASAFTVMMALGGYLPMQWYLNTAVPAVACLIIAVMVALSKLD